MLKKGYVFNDTEQVMKKHGAKLLLPSFNVKLFRVKLNFKLSISEKKYKLNSRHFTIKCNPLPNNASKLNHRIVFSFISCEIMPARKTI
jgi:hypothetical protein